MQQLKQLDEISLMELLNINSEDLVDRFSDLIENDPNRYERELQQWFPEEDDEDNPLD
jgi:hypothetical protein